MNTQPQTNNHNENNPSFDLIKTKETYAQEITQYFELQSESQSLLSQDHTPSEFLHILIENHYYNDAAAFWSGGNIEPAGEPIMEPPAYLYAKAVTSAIVMSATLDYPHATEVKARYQNYLKQGINIANG